MELERLLKKQIYRRTLRFFHENPASIDTAKGVATWTNQDVKEAKKALKKLADLGLLVAHRVSSTVGYSLTGNKRSVKKIERLLKE